MITAVSSFEVTVVPTPPPILTVDVVMLLQIYRAQQHAIFVRFRTTSNMNLTLPTLQFGNAINVRSVDLVEESKVCNGDSCVNIYGMTLFMQPLSCFVQGSVQILTRSNDTQYTVTTNAMLASENVCQVSSEVASFNGTLTTALASSPGVSASTFTVGDRIVGKVVLTSLYPIQSRVIENVLLCATSDATIKSCTEDVSKLIKGTYFVVNQLVQQPNTIVDNNNGQVTFDLNANSVQLSSGGGESIRHILEIQMRVQLGTQQQQERMKVVTIYAAQSFAAKKTFSNNLVIGPKITTSNASLMQGAVVLVILLLVSLFM